jgi:hypothetical protein
VAFGRAEKQMGVNNRILLLPPPPGLSRVETGAVQFGDDWPGLFLRGDNAHGLVVLIRQLTERLAEHPDPVVADLLARLTQWANLIDREVLVREAT